jgi:holo-[acyl-carrier protein] synthase
VTRGLGLDIVDVGAFTEQLADPASVFVAHTFTGAEQDSAGRRPTSARPQRLAARYAAKEALLKAWSATGGRSPAIPTPDLREIEVVHDQRGRPTIALSGAVAAAFPDCHSVHVSLSHDGGYAAAVVIIESQDIGVLRD